MKIKNLINFVIMVLLLSFLVYALPNLVYSLTLRYDDGVINNERLELIEGNPPDRLNQPEIGYTLRVKGVKGDVLHSFKFLIETNPAHMPPREIFDDDGNQIAIPEESYMDSKQTEIVLVVPYFENAKTIEIFNEYDQLSLSIDVSKYSKKTDVSFNFIYIIIIAIIVGLCILGIILYKKKLHKKKKKVKKKK